MLDAEGRANLSKRVRVLADAARLAEAAAECFLGAADQAIRAHGRFAVALSGGRTPPDSYRRLASSVLVERVDWRQVHVFFSDERCVPPDHPDSNYRMVRESLLEQIAIPAANVHRILGEIRPEAAAEEYESQLRVFFAPRRMSRTQSGEHQVPRFDLILLGMGEDGHTASLFPGAAGLQERSRWVVPQYVEKLNSWRVTLTLPVINTAAQVVFAVSGKSKAERVREVIGGAAADSLLPAQMVKPVSGELLWLVDADAASLLPQRDASRGKVEE